jgi:Zn-dependent M32 family carboxypeptidase
MSFLFGGNPPTTSQMAARFKTQVNRDIREIDRESARLCAEEKVLMVEVKKASVNNMKLSMQKAQAVVRTRRMVNRFATMKAHLQGIGSRIQSVRSTEGLQKAVGSAVQMMQQFNRCVGVKSLNMSLGELEKQNASMAMQTEMIDEQMDAVFEEDNDEEEGSDLVLQVLAEAGVSLPSARLDESDALSLEERLERVRPVKV